MKINETSTVSKAVSTTQVVGIIVIIVLAAGVGYYFYSTSGTAGTTSTTPAVTYKDTIVIGTTDSLECACVDPAKDYDYFGGSVLIPNLGAPLVDFVPGTTDTSPSAIQPALATKWTVSADGLAWTFILRSGTKFDDGTPFDSSVVKYSIDRGIRIADPDGAFVGLGYSDIIDSVTTPNATAVVFHLKSPFAPFLSLMTFATSFSVNPNRAPANSIVNFTSGDPVKSNPLGLGPYVLSEWTRSGNVEQEMKLDANPNYWNYPTYPKTPHIIIKFYTDATTLAAAVKAGDVDMGYRQFKTADIQSLQTTSGVKVWSSAGAFIQYLVINQHVKPLDNPVVRQAIAAAVNRSNLIKTVFLGTASPLYSQVPIGMFSHQDVFKTRYGDANYAKTIQLLSQAGYSSSNKLVVDLWYESSGHYPQSSDQALVLKNDLEASGVIIVNLHGTDWGTYRAQRRAGTMALFIMGWYPDFIDPFDYTQPFFQSSGSSWLNNGYNSTQMDSLIHQAITAASQPQALSLYQQIQQLSATDVPMVPLYQGGANCCGVVAKTSVS